MQCSFASCVFLRSQKCSSRVGKHLVARRSSQSLLSCGGAKAIRTNSLHGSRLTPTTGFCRMVICWTSCDQRAAILRRPVAEQGFVMKARKAQIARDTLETQISVGIHLDGTGVAKLASSIPFLDHMLDQVARHGMVDLDVTATGDIQIDPHHTVEDIGITLGQAVAKAVGDKKGLTR